MPTVRERNKKAVEHLTYQSVTAAQQAKVDALRKSAHQFAKVVIKNTELGAESTLAQRHIEDALNRAIRSVIFEAPVDLDLGGPPPVKKAPVRKTASAKKSVVNRQKAVKRRTY